MIEMIAETFPIYIDIWREFFDLVGFPMDDVITVALAFEPDLATTTAPLFVDVVIEKGVGARPDGGASRPPAAAGDRPQDHAHRAQTLDGSRFLNIFKETIGALRAARTDHGNADPLRLRPRPRRRDRAGHGAPFARHRAPGRHHHLRQCRAREDHDQLRCASSTIIGASDVPVARRLPSAAGAPAGARHRRRPERPRGLALPAAADQPLGPSSTRSTSWPRSSRPRRSRSTIVATGPLSNIGLLILKHPRRAAEDQAS